MIQVTPSIALEDQELAFNFVRASGPGGQNVNKVATSVQLRFDVFHSPSLPDEVKTRLVQIARNRISADGILLIEAHRFRTQEQNRQDAVDRLSTLITRASEKPVVRRPTRPGAAAKAARREAKRMHSLVKERRKKPENWE